VARAADDQVDPQEKADRVQQVQGAGQKAEEEAASAAC
jgi:hypothetical protein